MCRGQFHIPELRVGTLDSLLTLSDDLTKVRALNYSLLRLLIFLDWNFSVALPSNDEGKLSSCPSKFCIPATASSCK